MLAITSRFHQWSAATSPTDVRMARGPNHGTALHVDRQNSVTLDAKDSDMQFRMTDCIS